MERQGSPAAVLDADHFPPEPERLRRTAAAVLHEHAVAGGLCVVCGRPGRASLPGSPSATSRALSVRAESTGPAMPPPEAVAGLVTQPGGTLTTIRAEEPMR
jgi:hypothetical protein